MVTEVVAIEHERRMIRTTTKWSNNKNINYTKFTGPQMTVEAKMIFATDYWYNKLTDAQRKKLKVLKAKAKAQNNNNSPVSQTYNNNSSETQPSPVVSPKSGICNMLFNSTSRTPSSVINTCNCTYSVNQHKQRISGALIDGGANGGLSG
jgi:hypothetical protein